MVYCPLHCHDTFGSCGDSILRISDLTAKAKELGCPAVAITNHGSLATFVSFYEECKNKGINPIVGCEFYYVADRTVKDEETRAHLILLAKNYEGLRNLIRIHNDASEHFYPSAPVSVKPRRNMTAQDLLWLRCLKTKRMKSPIVFCQRLNVLLLLTCAVSALR